MGTFLVIYPTQDAPKTINKFMFTFSAIYKNLKRLKTVILLFYIWLNVFENEMLEYDDLGHMDILVFHLDSKYELTLLLEKAKCVYNLNRIRNKMMLVIKWKKI